MRSLTKIFISLIDIFIPWSVVLIIFSVSILILGINLGNWEIFQSIQSMVQELKPDWKITDNQDFLTIRMVLIIIGIVQLIISICFLLFSIMIKRKTLKNNISKEV